MRDPIVSAELAAQLGGSGQPLCWERLTAPETAELVERTDAVIIPVGATEQHGPHMALCVDTTIAHHVALGVSALTGIPVVPPLAYGVSSSHGDLPGTIALRPETMIMLVEDVVASLYARGIRQFVLLNGHTWNGGALDVSAEKLRVRFDDARVRYLAYVTAYPGSEVDGHVTYGRALMHANFFETSLMLHIDPDAVHLDRAVSLTDRDSFWDYRTDQVSRSGVWGRDIEQATAEHGASEMRRCIETTARAVAGGVGEAWPQPR
ncbi:creatininase family protein [Streptomyces sp. NPDC002896]|uniref:creatininase family protein n=1 Tax=Streptomyces sp. NPDC002896 TaxID=3154438 RepID=UPI00331A8341